MPASAVARVKGAVEDCIGKKVKFKLKKGKSRSHFNEGVILDTYPSIFTVYIEKKDYKRIVSFNYIDILTNNVEFYICDDKETRIG
ncbi:MAG TPA: Veg family protein [Sedimentibacter sp.]|nr:Veg family protein [Sedimentibacter sp.]NLA14106.1 Veg protein [Tissierellia bacterium]HOA19421.1 Veg family protein [Sedimentibacter sp.]HOG62923.1 Veg family protein [Sedimentibacter sp.]HPB79762.1 Veg family protein [Sedimentibacter sp.]